MLCRLHPTALDRHAQGRPGQGRSHWTRRAGLSALAGAAALALSGCTALMDMTISAQGTYDVVLEMRDTTGATFGQDRFMAMVLENMNRLTLLPKNFFL